MIQVNPVVLAEVYSVTVVVDGQEISFDTGAANIAPRASEKAVRDAIIEHMANAYDMRGGLFSNHVVSRSHATQAIIFSPAAEFGCPTPPRPGGDAGSCADGTGESKGGK